MPPTRYQVLSNGTLLYNISAIYMQELALGTYSVWVLDAPDEQTAAVIRQDPGVTLATSSDPLPEDAPCAPAKAPYIWSVRDTSGEFASIRSATVDAKGYPGSIYFYDDLKLVAIVPQPAGVAVIREDCILYSAT